MQYHRHMAEEKVRLRDQLASMKQKVDQVTKAKEGLELEILGL